MSLRVGPGAREDVAEIAEYMDTRTPGRGEAFIFAVERAYVEIGSAPLRQPPADDGPLGVECRYHLIHGFRYRVTFVVAGEDVYILSVAHVHQRPGHWHDRIPTDTPPEAS